LVKLDSLAM